MNRAAAAALSCVAAAFATTVAPRKPARRRRSKRECPHRMACVYHLSDLALVHLISFQPVAPRIVCAADTIWPLSARPRPAAIEY
jgi:hypothetical protein